MDDDKVSFVCLFVIGLPKLAIFILIFTLNVPWAESVREWIITHFFNANGFNPVAFGILTFYYMLGLLALLSGIEALVFTIVKYLDSNKPINSGGEEMMFMYCWFIGLFFAPLVISNLPKTLSEHCIQIFGSVGGIFAIGFATSILVALTFFLYQLLKTTTLFDSASSSIIDSLDEAIPDKIFDSDEPTNSLWISIAFSCFFIGIILLIANWSDVWQWVSASYYGSWFNICFTKWDYVGLWPWLLAILHKLFLFLVVIFVVPIFVIILYIDLCLLFIPGIIFVPIRFISNLISDIYSFFEDLHWQKKIEKANKAKQEEEYKKMYEQLTRSYIHDFKYNRCIFPKWNMTPRKDKR